MIEVATPQSSHEINLTPENRSNEMRIQMMYEWMNAELVHGYTHEEVQYYMSPQVLRDIEIATAAFDEQQQRDRITEHFNELLELFNSPKIAQYNIESYTPQPKIKDRYDQFLKDVRSIRTTQQKFAITLANHHNLDPKETLNSLKYSPKGLYYRSLEALNDSLSQRVLSDTQILESVFNGGEEGFRERVAELTNDIENIKIDRETITVLLQCMGPEEFVSYIYRYYETDPKGLSWDVAHLKAYLQTDTLDNLIRSVLLNLQSLSESHNISMLNEISNIAENLDEISPELQAFLKTQLRKELGSLTEINDQIWYRLDKLIDNGIIPLDSERLATILSLNLALPNTIESVKVKIMLITFQIKNGMITFQDAQTDVLELADYCLEHPTEMATTLTYDVFKLMEGRTKSYYYRSLMLKDPTNRQVDISGIRRLCVLGTQPEEYDRETLNLWFEAAIIDESSDLFSSNNLEYWLSSDILTDSQKNRLFIFIKGLGKHDLLFSALDSLDSIINPEEIKSLVRSSILHVNPSKYFQETNGETILSVAQYFDQEEYKTILRNKILDVGNHEYLSLCHPSRYMNGRTKPVLSEFFSLDELKAITIAQAKQYPDLLFNYYRSIRDAFGDSFLSELIHESSDEDDGIFIRLVAKHRSLFDEAEVISRLQRISSNRHGTAMILRNLGSLVPLEYSHEFLSKLVLRNYAYHTITICGQLQNCEKLLDAAQMMQLQSSLVSLNPTAYYAATHGEITDPEILRSSIGVQFIPTSINAKVAQFIKATEAADPQRIAKIINQVSFMNHMISTVNTARYMEIFLTLKTEKNELEVLESLYSLSVFSAINPDFEIDPEKLTSIESINEILLDTIVDKLGIAIENKSEQYNNFWSVVERPLPFFVYYSQYIEDPKFTSRITQLVTSYLNGQETDSISNAELKQQGLIPQTSTEAQQTTWNETTQITVEGNYQSSPERIYKSIILYLQNNEEHIIADNPLIETPQEELLTIQNKINGDRQEVLKAKDKDHVRLAEINGRANLVSHVLDLHSLKNFSADSITSGTIADYRWKTIPLEKLFSRMRDRVATEHKFAFNEILRLLKAEGSIKGPFAIEDTNRSQTKIEIGSEPVESCQHYLNGVYNECLLGYFDPNIKIITLRRKETDTLYARAIARYLDTSNGSQALFMEYVYNSFPSPKIAKDFVAFVFKKAKLMGVTPVIQLMPDQDGNVDLSIYEPYVLKPADYTLESKNSLAPYSYVDSSGGMRKGGDYSIGDLYEIHLPSTK
jgi:hypothetical protein